MQSVLTVICSTLFASRGYHDAHTIPCKRIAKLLRDCRIVLCNAEMPRHGRRGKEKSSHGWRVSTFSSSYENLQSIICTVSWLRSVADTEVYAAHRGARVNRPVLLTLQYYSLNESISPTLEDYRLDLSSCHHFIYCVDNLFSITHE